MKLEKLTHEQLKAWMECDDSELIPMKSVRDLVTELLAQRRFMTAQQQTEEKWAWQEYDQAADDLARRGLTGTIGDSLPENMMLRTVELINDDPEAFQERVRMCAYAQAMNRHA